MYMSHEEFEGYLAKQQAKQPTAPTPKRTRTRSREEIALSYLLCAIPLLAVIAIIPFMTLDANRKQADRTETWDSILGITASATGYEYDANADTLQERLTFKKKR